MVLPRRARCAISLLLPLLAACSLAKLTPGGKAVVVAPSPANACKPLGSARAAEGYNFQSSETNRELVLTALRNRAAEQGGDTIVITSQEIGVGSDALGATPSRTSEGGKRGCPNCIAMVAAIYTCASSSPARPTTAANKPAPSASAPKPPPAPPSPFPATAATAALDAAAESAARCKATGGPTGEATVKVTFAQSGDVVYAEAVGAPFENTPVGECIARKFRNAKVPPFEGPPVSLSKTVQITP